MRFCNGENDMLTLGAQIKIDINLNPMSIIKKDNNAWNDVDWAAARINVRKIQYRIYEASRLGQTKRLHWLQKMLINRFDAKLLAVQLVTNKLKVTAGYDNLVKTSSETKYNLAVGLRLDGKSQPIRQIWIEKPGKFEKRPLGINT